MTTVYDFIAQEEGFRSKPYLCSEGYPTVGYGQKIGPKGADLSLYQINIPEPVAKAWLKHNVDQIAPAATAICGPLDGVRKAAVVSMIYQMGEAGFLGFRNCIAGIKVGDWQRAHDEALDSRWAKQTPERAKRTALMLLTGEWQ